MGNNLVVISKSMTKVLVTLFLIIFLCGLVQAQGGPVQPTPPGVVGYPGEIETPPIPGEVYRPQEPKENEEMKPEPPSELPPRLEAIDREIKASTMVLKSSLRGSSTSEPSRDQHYDQSYYQETESPGIRESHPKKIVSPVLGENKKGPGGYEGKRLGYNVKKDKSPGFAIVKSMPKTKGSSRKGVFLIASVILMIGAFGFWFLHRHRT